MVPGCLGVSESGNQFNWSAVECGAWFFTVGVLRMGYCWISVVLLLLESP